MTNTGTSATGGQEICKLPLQWVQLQLYDSISVGTLDKTSINCIKERLITYVTDRLGHDARYAIDSRKLQAELGWANKAFIGLT